MIEKIFSFEKAAPKNSDKKFEYTLDEIAEIRKEKQHRQYRDFLNSARKNKGELCPKA